MSSSSSRHILSAGIFSSEPGQRLLSICDTLTRRAFQGLHAKCKDDVRGSYYQTGLKRVHVWSDAIVNEDIDFVRNTCPDIDETYEMCFVHYVEERFRGNRRPVIHCPALLKFVRHFLESAALHEHLQTAEFFTTRDVVQKRITCMDACRQAFYSLVNADSVRVELESTVSRGTAPPSEVSVARAPLPPPSQRSEEVVLESEEPELEILPSDSISQIDVPHSVVSQTYVEERARRRPAPRREEEDRDVDTPSPPPRKRDSRGTDPREEEESCPTQEEPRSSAPPPPRKRDSRGTDPREEEESCPTQEEPRSSAPPPPSSYISTASSTSRRRADDGREQRRIADDNAVRRYKPELLDEGRSEVRSEISRHDFEMVDSASVASLRTRSVVGSRDSSVSIGMKRLKSPRSN